MKLSLIKITLTIYLLAYVCSEKEQMSTLDQDYTNPTDVYQGFKPNHSLYNTSTNPKNAISNYPNNIPPPDLRENQGKQQYQDEEHRIAKRMVNQARKAFEFCDKNADNLVTPDELAIAYQEYGWPKELGGAVDNVSYAREIMKKYDVDGKGALTFSQFMMLEQSLYGVKDQINEQECNHKYDKALEVWNGFFKWLDYQQKGTIGEEEIFFGVSKMMGKDVDNNEVMRALEKYGGQEKRMNIDQFVLAVANGDLNNTFQDPNYYKNKA